MVLIRNGFGSHDAFIDVHLNPFLVILGPNPVFVDQKADGQRKLPRGGITNGPDLNGGLRT